MSFLLILNGIYYINLLLRYFYFLAVMSNTIMTLTGDLEVMEREDTGPCNIQESTLGIIYKVIKITS